MQKATAKTTLLSVLLIAFLIWGCKKDKPQVVPTITTNALTNITPSSVTTGGAIVNDGGSAITARGIVLSKSHSTPSITDTVVNSSNATDNFSVDLTGLDFNTTYYIRAFATNSTGTGYGSVVTLNTNNDTTKIRFTYNGQTVTYGVIISPVTHRKWMDRNLGATQAATSATDYQAYGDLFQWGRPADGHQLMNWTSAGTGTLVNDTTHTLSETEIPGHSKFIVFTYPVGSGQTYKYTDWYAPSARDQFNMAIGRRWMANPQGPCPNGWHVPTDAEWAAETEITQVSTGYSSLKLTAAGRRKGVDYGSTVNFYDNTGAWGYYWASDTRGDYARIEPDYFGSGYGDFPTTGMCVRCIKDL
jgi:uncharacterized protein (TIGR02145 family)